MSIDLIRAPVVLRTSYLALCAIFAFQVLGGGKEKQKENSTLDMPTAEVDLEVIPARSAVSHSVVLTRKGRCEIVQYDRYKLVVLQEYRGVVPDSRLSSLWNRIGDHAFLAELRSVSTGSQLGMEPTDLFSISITTNHSVALTHAGPLKDSPDIVQLVVHDLLTLTQEVTKMSLNAAYLRSSELPGERLHRLERRARIRFQPLDAFPGTLQHVVSKAIVAPKNFVPLKQEQYDLLLKETSQGHELFVKNNESGYQITLFRGRPPAPGDGQ